MLHAWRLGFTHPSTAEFRTHEAPVPPEFAPFLPEPQLLERIRNTSTQALRNALTSES